MIDKDLTKYKKWKDEQTATEDKSADTDKDSKPTFKKSDTKKSDKEQSSKDK